MKTRYVSEDGFAINSKKPRSKYSKRRKKPKKLINIIFSQKTTIILMLLLQFVQIFVMFTILNENYNYLSILFSTLGIGVAIYIVNTDRNPAYKLAWIVPLLIFPVFTSILYLILANQPYKRKVSNAYVKKNLDTRCYLPEDTELTEKIKTQDPELYRLVRYLDDSAGFPAYGCEDVTYFPLGEDKFASMVTEMRKAEKFIFMEYFIVDDGEMWGEILDILVEKASAGVEVRLIVDGMGSQFTMPAKDKKAIEKAGGRVIIFNKFRPMISTIQNNRDHRKILVIDGNVGFTGGVNIADEYINRLIRFGHWKDTAIMIRGQAVWNLTMMVLQMWEVITHESTDYEKYRPSLSYENTSSQGIIVPYSDTPLDSEKIGRMVYMSMINTSKKYLYISTPYFIPDNEILTSLELAAKSGVDVRIITPHIPDKWYIQCITRSYYIELLNMGVKVYEYVPGFIHAKNCLSDDKRAVVGTINFDYRSLYLHFEDAAFMQDTACIPDIKEDFDDLFENKCHRITYDDVRRLSFASRFMSVILRIFAPLL
ncbi:cardiolipin synthase [Ruminococcus albus]|uniref:Cardiolipin synthase n=1 Tax=Ruminococcus albus (strain ATCC 27210 / DSM 20455 / JCM 14654 / NCDO 2250 / 7) TaxID=697329 RepID=E6UGS5_RUMA7|nr:cardiolipin synthase [Ruminococcus albus]ADU23737.1 phospholipase D/Transphosphatidylase [Ruminococcus albus 7 = DSM 20455]